MEQVLLSEMVPKEILQELQDAVARYTGMASLMSDANGTPVTNGSNFTHFCMDLTRRSAVGGKNCQECGRRGALQALKTGKPAVYPCHAGLMDYAAPILLNGEFIGSFTGGQVRTTEVDEVAFRQKAIEYDIDPDEYIAAAKATNLVPKEEVERSAQFLSEIANVISKLAYQRFQLLEEKQLSEQAALAQAERLRQYSIDFDKDLRVLADFLEDVSAEGAESGKVTRERSEKMLEDMYRHSSQLGETIDYMETARDDSRLHETPYDIRWVVDRKLRELSAIAEGQGDRVDCHIDDSVPRTLVGDATRIGNIISKCIENSIHYTESGEIRVSISTRKEGYATVLVMEIADRGGGMEQADATRIRDYIRSRGSSGIWDEKFEEAGFALIGFLLQALSGQIDITSEPGKGTVVSIAVPQLEG